MNTLEQCRALYREAFGEDDIEFETALFENCFKYCKWIEENGRIVSMLFLLPTVFKAEQQSIKGAYIYAAATLKEYRGNGYMSRLIEEIKGDFPLFLRPANDNLINFYENLGFKTLPAEKSNNLPSICPAEDFLTLAKLFADDENGEKYTAMYYAKDLTLRSLNFINTME